MTRRATDVDGKIGRIDGMKTRRQRTINSLNICSVSIVLMLALAWRNWNVYDEAFVKASDQFAKLAAVFIFATRKKVRPDAATNGQRGLATFTIPIPKLS